MSVTTCDPLPDLTAAEAQALSGDLSRASVDLWSLCLARRGYGAHRERIAEPDQLADRLRLLAFHLLDAAGWPEVGWGEEDAEGLPVVEQAAFSHRSLSTKPPERVADFTSKGKF